MGSLRDRKVAGSALDHRGPNFESNVWSVVSSDSPDHLKLKRGCRRELPDELAVHGRTSQFAL